MLVDDARSVRPAAVVTGRVRLAWARLRLDIIGGLCLLIYLAYVLSSTRTWGHLNTGDSNNLVRGTRAALRCLSSGRFFECGYISGTPNSYVHGYPLLQYIPAAFFMSLGASDAGILRSLAALNWVALLAACFAIVATFRKRHNVGVVAIACIVLSSMTYQVSTAFGESLASAMVVFAVCAAVRRKPLELALLVGLACTGKETLAPFVVVLAIVCARRSGDRLLPTRRLTAAIVAGAVMGIVVNSAFNVFRFGTLSNRFYLDPAWRTPGVAQKLRFGAALLASPAGGIIWYWPLLAMITVAAGAIAVRRMRRSFHDVAGWLPILCVLATLIVWLCSLMAWWAPFGWVAYGPRLDVPLLGGLAVALAHLTGEPLVRGLRRSRVAFELTIGAVAFGSLQLGAPWRWPRVIINRFAAGSGCPSFGDLDVHRKASQYYRCVDQMFWRMRPPIVRDLLNLSGTSGATAWLFGGLGIILVLLHVRRPECHRDTAELEVDAPQSAIAGAS